MKHVRVSREFYERLLAEIFLVLDRAGNNIIENPDVYQRMKNIVGCFFILEGDD